MDKELGARDHEAALLARCVAVARQDAPGPADQREANVFRVAAMVVLSRFPKEAKRLQEASEHYFDRHPEEKLHTDEVVRNGWIWGLPRLRDMLSREFLGS